MVICPRCQQPVDETVRTTCPLCFTPLPQSQKAPAVNVPDLETAAPHGGQSVPQMPNLSGAPMPIEPMPMPRQMQTPTPPPARAAAFNPGARVSLTGEVIDPGNSVGPPPSYVGGAAPGALPKPGASHPSTRVPSTVYRPDTAAPEKGGSGNMVGIVVALIVVLGGGAGGWYWWMHRTNPKDQAEAVYKAFISGNSESVYSLVLLSDEDKKKYPDAKSFAHEGEAFSSTVRRFPNADKALEEFKSSAKAGEPVITGDKAEVPTSATVNSPFGAVTLHGKAHMVNDGGIWKLDLTNRSGQAILDLFGSSNIPSGRSGFKGQ